MPFDVEGAEKAGASLPQIADFLAQHAHFDVDAARKAGATDQQIIGFLKDHPRTVPQASPEAAQEAQQGYVSPDGSYVPPAAIPTPQQAATAGKDLANTSVIGPIARGAAQTEAGIANTIGLVAPKAGADIRNGIDPAMLDQSSISNVAAGIKSGNYGKALEALPSAVLESVPQLAGAVAAGAVGGPVGLGAYGAATQGGDLANERAANNGRSQPDLADKIIGLTGAAALNAVPGVRPITGLERSAVDAGLPGIIAKTAKHAGADALQSLGQQAVATAGTQNGGTLGTYDPSQVAAQTAIGAVSRPALGVARGVSDRVAAAGQDSKALLQDQWAGLTDTQQAQARASAGADAAVRRVQGNAATGEAPSYREAALTAADDAAGGIKRLTDTLDRQGVLDDEGKATLLDTLRIAKSPDLTLTQEHLDAIKGLGLDTETQGQLEDTLRQVDLLTGNGTAERSSRIAGAVGGLLGHAAGYHLAGMTLGGSMAAHVALGRGIGEGGRSAAQSLADRFGLTRQPQLAKQGAVAMAMLDANGLPTPDSKAGLVDAIGKSRDVIATQAALMGLDPSRYTVSAAERVAQQRAKVAQQAQAQADAAAQKAKAEADSKDVTIQAQRRLDVAAFKAAVDLEAANRSPAATPATEGTPTAAAMAMAQRRAEMLRRLAGEGGDAADRAAVGNPVTDPVPVNQPTTAGPANNNAAPGFSPNTPEGVHAAVAQDGATAATEGPTAGKGVGGTSASPKVARTSTDSLTALAAPDGLSPEALRHGELLPEWMYGLGANVSAALHEAGTPKPLNFAQEVGDAVQRLERSGAFDPQFARTLMAHRGRVVRGLYNLIRVEMLVAHGIDRRTLDAQAADGAGRQQAAE